MTETTKRSSPTPQAFLKSVKAKRLGPVFTFAEAGTTYRVASKDLLERALFDLFKQKSDGKPWAAPGGKALPPYNPVHEPSDEFKQALSAFLK